MIYISHGGHDVDVITRPLFESNNWIIALLSATKVHLVALSMLSRIHHINMKSVLITLSMCPCVYLVDSGIPTRIFATLHVRHQNIL